MFDRVRRDHPIAAYASGSQLATRDELAHHILGYRQARRRLGNGEMTGSGVRGGVLKHLAKKTFEDTPVKSLRGLARNEGPRPEPNQRLAMRRTAKDRANTRPRGLHSHTYLRPGVQGGLDLAAFVGAEGHEIAGAVPIWISPRQPAVDSPRRAISVVGSGLRKVDAIQELDR